jgi:undecaprenyl-diphosphatase
MSRIVLKMHYPTDVLAGFCLAFIWVILSFYVLNRIQLKKSRRQQHLKGDAA